MSIEETLCHFHNHFGDDGKMSVKIQGRLRPSIVINAKGECYNPLEDYDMDPDMEPFIESLRDSGISPSYSRNNDENIVVYRLPLRHIGDLQRVALAIVLAVVIGIAMRNGISAESLSYYNEKVMTPICDIFLDLLSAVSLPLIFFSIIKVLTNDSMLRTQNGMGKHLVYNVGGVNLLSLIVSIAAAMMVFGVVPSNATVSTDHSVVEIITDMFIPGNIAKAFAEGSTAQVLFVAIATGYTMRHLKERVRIVRDIVFQINEILMSFITFIAKLLPLFIFVQLLILVTSDNVTVFYDFGTMLAANYSVGLVYLIAMLLYASVSLHIGILDFARGTMKVFILGTTTMSSFMCIPTMIDCCTRQFGRDKDFCNIMVPTVVMTNKLLEMTCLSMLSFCGVSMMNVEITWSALFIFAFLTYMLSYATPSVPGGLIATMTMLFNVLGIPMEYIGIAAMIAPFTEIDAGVQTLATTVHVLRLSRRKG